MGTEYRVGGLAKVGEIRSLRARVCWERAVEAVSEAGGWRIHVDLNRANAGFCQTRGFRRGLAGSLWK